MSQQQPERIAVERDNQLVPLFPGCNHSQAPRQPWSGVLLEHHAVPAIEIPEHEHHELCLHLQTSGDESMEWWSAGRNAIERTAPGGLLLVPAGTRDRIRWQGASDRLLLTVSNQALLQASAEADTPEPEFAVNWALNDPTLARLLADMGQQAKEGWPMGSLYADLTSASLISHLLRRYAVNPVATPEVHGGLPMPLLRRSLEYINEHLADDLTLEQIAQQAGLSAFHFARGFRTATGITPYQYLLDRRIQHAQNLLRHRDWTVQEIAQLTGFRSPVNFVRSFRQRVGVTPGAWRKDN